MILLKTDEGSNNRQNDSVILIPKLRIKKKLLYNTIIFTGLLGIKIRCYFDIFLIKNLDAFMVCFYQKWTVHL